MRAWLLIGIIVMVVAALLVAYMYRGAYKAESKKRRRK